MCQTMTDDPVGHVPPHIPGHCPGNSKASEAAALQSPPQGIHILSNIPSSILQYFAVLGAHRNTQLFFMLSVLSYAEN